MFELTEGSICTWPLSNDDINNFCYWALTVKKLKYSTVSAYISSISLAHKLRGMDNSACYNHTTKLILRSAENMTLYEPCKTRNRNVMTLSLLKILGNEIAITNWTNESKQLFWTVSCIAFFGSFRMGELLNGTITKIDSATSLLWKDLKYNGKSWLIHVKAPKSRTQGGEFIDIFPFKNHNCCPVAALNKWKEISKHSEIQTNPVFIMSNGCCLTQKVFNKTIQNLLCHRLGDSCKNISGHSFRAGIPSALAKNPELASDTHIMGWGRWCSPAYQTYTRLKLDQKESLFHKIVNVLNS